MHIKACSSLTAVILLLLSGEANAQTRFTLWQFTGGSDGAQPHAPLVQGNDGDFYGTTKVGGNGYGTVFRISPWCGLTTLWEFTGGTDGANPVAGLVQGSDGDFYGTTPTGGANGYGTVFRISPTGVLTNLYSFSGPDGANPQAGLVQGSDSNFYGTTCGTELNLSCQNFGSLPEYCGTVFQISPSGTLTTLWSFTRGGDGSNPQAGLVQGADGNFYGTTTYGGSIDGGTVFRISPSGTLTTLWSFGDYPGGAYPEATLVQGSDGNFYGTTYADTAHGILGWGTIFAISPSGVLTTLWSFVHSSTGVSPHAALVQGTDGNFYGTTYASFGTVFAISPSGTLTTLYTFVVGVDGIYPEAGLVQGSDGYFYGTASCGGRGNIYGCGDGTVFKFPVSVGTNADCTFSIDSTNATFTAAGGSDSVNVTASTGCVWTAVTSDDFITITSGCGSSGNGTVFYSVAANTSSNAGRVGSMTIAGQTYTVTQGAVCGYTFLPPTSVKLMPAAGGSTTVYVLAHGTDCIWTAVSNDPFITITKHTGETVRYSVRDNTNNVPRTGTITIAGQTFTVNQRAGGCTFSLGKGARFKAVGGSKTVKVKLRFNDCTWTAISNDSFITISGDGSGVGRGIITYSVAANTNTVERSGTMTIAGKTYTIIQPGER